MKTFWTRVFLAYHRVIFGPASAVNSAIIKRLKTEYDKDGSIG